jgi:hypothetical protein
MKKDLLQEISKDNKIDFLKKLSSGKFILGKPYDPPQPLSFDLQPDGLYLCKETGKLMSKEEIEFLPGYRMSIHLVATKEQVRNEKPPSGIVLTPYSKKEYLNSLLINNERYSGLTDSELDWKIEQAEKMLCNIAGAEALTEFKKQHTKENVTKENYRAE